MLTVAGCSEMNDSAFNRNSGQDDSNANRALGRDGMDGISPNGRNMTGRDGFYPGNRTRENRTGFNRTAMLELQEKACSEKSLGDSCTFDNARGDMTGICSDVENKLVCMPQMPQGPPQ